MNCPWNSVCLFSAALGLRRFCGLSVVGASGATLGWGGRASRFTASRTAGRGFQTRGLQRSWCLGLAAESPGIIPDQGRSRYPLTACQAVE